MTGSDRRSCSTAPRNDIRLACLLVVLYTIAAVGLTWPLVLRFASDLPRHLPVILIDQYYAGWALAWQAHALVTHPLAFADANIYAPTPHALFYGTPGFALLPLYAPVFLATGDPTIACNATLILAVATVAAALHWVTVRWTGATSAGVAAAGTYLVSGQAFGFGAFFIQYTALAGMPLVLALIAGGDLGRRRTAVLAGLIAAQALADVVYVAPAVLGTVGALAALMLLRRTTRSDGGRVLIALGLAGCALLPVYGGYLAVLRANPNIVDQTVWHDLGGRHDAMLFRSPLPWLPRTGPLALDRLVYGTIAAGLAAAIVVPPKPRGAWVCALVTLLLGWAASWMLPGLYPSLRAHGTQHGLRAVLRLGLFGLVAASLLVGLSLHHVSDVLGRFVGRRARGLVAWTACTGFLLVRAPWLSWTLGSYPTAPAATAGAEAGILRAGHGPVLVLPVGGMFAHYANAVAMYQSTAHWRPLVNGYSSYYPEGFAERMQLAQRLPDAAALDALAHQTELTTIVVHGDGFSVRMFQPWLAAISAGQLPRVRVRHRDAQVLVLDVEPLRWSVGSSKRRSDGTESHQTLPPPLPPDLRR